MLQSHVEYKKFLNLPTTIIESDDQFFDLLYNNQIDVAINVPLDAIITKGYSRSIYPFEKGIINAPTHFYVHKNSPFTDDMIKGYLFNQFIILIFYHLHGAQLERGKKSISLIFFL